MFGITLKADGSGFTGTLTAAGAQLKQLGATGAEAGNQIGAGMGRARAGVQSISEQLQRLQHIAQAYLGGRAAMDVIRLADQYVGLQARLKLATTSQLEFNTANAALYAIAQRNGVPLAESLALYSKLAPALRALGGTQAQTLTMTDLVGKSLRLSGAGAAQSAAAMMQLSQALGSGVLRGDEFNSLMENSPRLMMAVADGMGKPIGALRKMAEEGELTAGVVVNALLSQKQKLESEYGQLPLTVSAAWTKLGNAVTREIGRLDKGVGGATGSMAAAIGGLADNLAALEGALISAATVAAGIFVASLVSVRAAAIAAAGMAGIGMLRNTVAGLVLLFEVGGIAGVAKGILGIGTAAAAATPAAVTLSGAIKGIVWPAALAYGVYEFGKYVFETFKSVRLYVTEFVATAQRAAAYLAHPIDAGARKAALKEIQDTVDAVWAMEYPAAPGAPKPAGKDAPLKPGGAGDAKDAEEREKRYGDAIKASAKYLDQLRDEAATEGALAEQKKMYAAARQADALLAAGAGGEMVAGYLAQASAYVTAEAAMKRADADKKARAERLAEQARNLEEAWRGSRQKAGEIAEASAKKIADSQQKEAERAARSWERFTENVQRNLGDVLYNGLQGKFDGIGDMFLQMLLRMQADAAAARLSEALFPEGGGGLAGFIGGLFGSRPTGLAGMDQSMPIMVDPLAAAKGAWFDGGVHEFARGGVVDSPTPFRFASGGAFRRGVMGEAGPEAIMPLRRDSAGRLGVNAQGGGGVVVNIIESPGNAGQVQQRNEGGVSIIDVFVAKVKSAIASDITRGSGDIPAALSRTYGMNRAAGAY